VIEEDHPQPHAAEQVEPEVTLDRNRIRRFALICHVPARSDRSPPNAVIRRTPDVFFKIAPPETWSTRVAPLTGHMLKLS
jgi:hypothetical protein